MAERFGAPLITGTPSCTVSATGVVSASFVVSSTITPALYTIRVTDSLSGGFGFVADQTFTVNPRPTITLTPPGGGPIAGATVTVTSGTLFSPTDAGVCTISSSPSGLIFSQICIIDLTGTLVTPASSFVISPTATSQPYLVTVQPLHGDTSAVVSLTPATPSIILSPTSGVGGTFVSISGSGFSLTDINPCTISSTPTGLITGSSCAVSGPGTLAASFTVISPTPLIGTYVVQVTGSSGDKALATFTVGSPSAQVFLNPNVGPSGTLVSVTGSGFNPADASCTITGPSVGSSTCQVTAGNVVGSYTANSAPQGLSIVLVSGFGYANDFAVAIYSIPVMITTTTTTTPTTTSVTLTTGIVTTTSSQVTLTTTTFTSTGVSTWTSYTRTTTTISGQSTVSTSTTTITTQVVTSASTSTTTTTTTTTFNVVSPHAIAPSTPPSLSELIGACSVCFHC